MKQRKPFRRRPQRGRSRRRSSSGPARRNRRQKGASCPRLPKCAPGWPGRRCKRAVQSRPSSCRSGPRFRRPAPRRRLPRASNRSRTSRSTSARLQSPSTRPRPRPRPLRRYGPRRLPRNRRHPGGRAATTCVSESLMALVNTGRAIGAVTQTLRERLTTVLGAAVGQVTVGRPEPPAAALAGSRLNLFLYEIHHDEFLRNESLDDGQPPPLWLVLRYLLTAFDEGGDSDTVDAHEILGEGLRAL